MICPKYHVRPREMYRVNEFITPYDPVIVRKANELRKEAEMRKIEPLVVVFNFVSTEIKYIRDKRLHGYEEYWTFPRETLRYRRGDCEDTSFLLASLLIASGIDKRHVRVVLGSYKGYGHAGVEILTTNGWYILESTSDQPLRVGINAWKIEDGYKMNYSPELYIYVDYCEFIQSGYMIEQNFIINILQCTLSYLI